MLVSNDGGATWAARELQGFARPDNAPVNVAALSAHEALLSLGDSTLWRTTDAGTTWRQERPMLPTP